MLLFAANHLPPPITEVMEDLYNYVNPLNSRHSPMISKETLDIVLANKDVSMMCLCMICLFFPNKVVFIFNVIFPYFPSGSTQPSFLTEISLTTSLASR